MCCCWIDAAVVFYRESNTYQATTAWLNCCKTWGYAPLSQPESLTLVRRVRLKHLTRKVNPNSHIFDVVHSHSAKAPALQKHGRSTQNVGTHQKWVSWCNSEHDSGNFSASQMVLIPCSRINWLAQHKCNSIGAFKLPDLKYELHDIHAKSHITY